MEPTIFVAIASYRDKDCKNTLSNLFDNAKNPERVYVGLCEQNDPNHPLESCGGTGPRVRQITMHSKDARGPTFARYLSSTLWQEEDYFLQLDSHVRMVKDWDEKLIQTVKQIQMKTGNPRIALST
ncbi:N-acetylglucosaminyltransferase, partial [Quaeritorhiza haematococci]